MKKIFLKLKNHSHFILFAPKSIERFSSIFAFLSKKKTVVITDTNVAKLYRNKICERLRQINAKVEQYTIASGEKHKSRTTLDKILEYLIKEKHDRNTILIALGGGVIGDLVGFVASIYKRGIKFIQYPTTLLSQVDASIGGKNGINHPYGKNMIGTFYHPMLVIVDIDFLKTLPKREFASGLAEVVKYAVSFDPCFFRWLENNIEKLLQLNPQSLSYCIQRCCFLKSEIVSRDENENKERMLLNFGHTYGHALENLTEYKAFSHGEAISIGMMMAAYTAKKTNGFEYTNRIHGILKKAKLPTRGPRHISPQRYIQCMMNDKKCFQDKIRFILPFALGKTKIYSNIKKRIIASAIVKNTRS